MDAVTGEWWRTLATGFYVTVVCVLLFVICSYLSLRFLRGLPDFPDRDAMLRGARWGGVVAVLVSGVYLGFPVLGISVIHTPLSSLFVAKAFLYTVVFWLAMWRAEEFSGAMACLLRLRYWRKFDLEAWLRDREAAAQRSRRAARWVPWLLAAVVVLQLGMAGWSYGKFDREFALWAREERFSRELQQALAGPEVEEVLAVPHLWAGPLYPLIIQVHTGTTSAQGRTLVERMKHVLAARQDRRMWRIYARPEHGHTLAQGYYVPLGMTLPPNADKLRPTPGR